MKSDKVARISFYVFCFSLLFAGINNIRNGYRMSYITFLDSGEEFWGIAVTGGFVSLLSILGIVSVCCQSQFAIRVFAVLSAIAFVAMLTLFCMTFHADLEDNVTELVGETWKEEQVTQGSMDLIQIAFTCCGVEGSHDYTSLGRDIPQTCCSFNQATCHGCREMMVADMKMIYAIKNRRQLQACVLLFLSPAISMMLAYKLKKSEEIGFERFTS